MKTDLDLSDESGDAVGAAGAGVTPCWCVGGDVDGDSGDLVRVGARPQG